MLVTWQFRQVVKKLPGEEGSVSVIFSLVKGFKGFSNSFCLFLCWIFCLGEV